jgi:hypothetical protein
MLLKHLIKLLLLVLFVRANSAEIRVLHSDKSSLRLSIKNDKYSFDTLALADGTICLKPQIPNAFNIVTTNNAPTQYVYRSLITLPSDKGTKIKSITPKGVKSYNFPINPVVNASYLKDVPQSIDYSKYSELNNNSEFASLNYVGIVTSKYVAQLDITLAKYNQTTQSIEIPTEIEVEIEFPNVAINSFSLAESNYNPVNTINNIPEWNNLALHNERFTHLLSGLESQLKGEKNKLNSLQSQESSQYLKIAIPEEGIYQVTEEDFRKLGIDVNSIDASTIKVYGNPGYDLPESASESGKGPNNPVPVILRKDASGKFQSIVFFAPAAKGFTYGRSFDNAVSRTYFKHYNNHFTNTNYFTVRWGGSQGSFIKDTVYVGPHNDTIVYKPVNRYTKSVFFEEELFNPYPTGSGRQFLGRSFFTNPITMNLPGILLDDTITYRIATAVYSRTDRGVFEFLESGKEIPSKNFHETSGDYVYGSRREILYSAPASTLLSGENSSLKLNLTNTSNSAIGYLDYIEWHYRKELKAENNTIGFITEPYLSGHFRYDVPNFNTNDILILEVTDHLNPKLYKNYNFGNNNNATLLVYLNYNEPKKFYFASEFKRPTSIESISSTKLRTEFGNEEAILITPRDFTKSAEAFKKYREEKSGIKIKIVNIDDIYTEFTATVPDIAAIREYLYTVMVNSEVVPKYLILWGDGHYDYKNISLSSKNYIPAHEDTDDNMRFDEIDSPSIDDFYGRIIGNDRAVDIGIGRIPINSDEQGMKVVEKIKHYENNSSKDNWRSALTVVADDGWTSKSTGNSSDGAMHTNQAEVLVTYSLPKDFIVNKLYLPKYPALIASNGARRKPQVTADMLNVINNNGTQYLTFIGHGNPQTWAHEGIFSKDENIPSMSNIDKLFFLSAATCDFGRFDMGSNQSGAEEIFLSDKGGAIAVFSATRVVFAGDNSIINNNMSRMLFTRNKATGLYPTFGEVMKELKTTFTNSNDEKYFFICDPTMRMLVPEQNVVFDSVNGNAIANGVTQVKGLEKVRITGRITHTDNTTDNTFNGNITLSLFDGDNLVSVFDEDGVRFNFFEYGGALNRATYKVENGNFTAEFTLPKDISFSDSTARLFGYAFSTDNKFANGQTRAIKVNGISTGSSDGKPEIKIYLDSRRFVSCGTVGKNPLLIVDLSDKYGINSTGVGIGHKIEAWIDDNPNSIDLTRRFEPSLNDPRKGSISQPLINLSRGEHKVRVRAWNIYNNFNEETVCFNVLPDSINVVITEVLASPNPMDISTIIGYKHNIEPPYTLEASIHNQVGKRVYYLNQEVTSSNYFEFPWNGTDEQGSALPSGNYNILINLTSKKGHNGTGFGNVNITR